MAFDQKIALITYDYHHHKTQEILWRLKVSGYTNVHIFALPFILRKRKNPPIFKHRPSYPYQVEPEKMASNLDYFFKRVNIDDLHAEFTRENFNKILIAGAGLLPKNLVSDFNLINAHPAILPHVRGLDAFKWALVEQKPIGVTVHIVNAAADAGWMILQKEVAVYVEDTWHDLAMRLFYLEMDLMIEAIPLAINKSDLDILPEEGKVHKRMLPKIEKDLLTYFTEYKNKFAKER